MSPQPPPTTFPRPTERIYIGGLDPTRGLTVDLVASRLRSVPDVEILSINDAPLDDDTPTPDPSIYGHKNTIVDADGDHVDTRRFFFLEARRTVDTVEDSSSALQLLAKQYHHAKWKGCQLRVEEAKPPFLQRLEQERRERESARQKRIFLESAAHHVAEQTVLPSPDKNGDDCQHVAVSTAKQRRRLRIRRKFGQEAYHVDTYPQVIEMSPLPDDRHNNNNNNSTGWEQFATLYQRMTHKRESQWKKLLERRKEERRSWSKGEKKGEKHNHSKDADDEGLRGLLFLNRGIHIRFNDGEGSDVKTVLPNESDEYRTGLREVDAVSTSSLQDDDSDDADRNDKKAYVWSDEDEDESSQSVISSEDEGSSSIREERNSGHDYVWSDEESDKEHCLKKDGSNVKIKSNTGMEEFSGEMHVYDDDSTGSSSGQSNQHGDETSSHHDNSDGGSVRLEEDIRSNLGILSKLFPEERISMEPLANVESTAEILQDVGRDGAEGVGTIRNSSAVFGGGLILQRYDPTKEDAAFDGKKSSKSRHDDAKHDGDTKGGQESGATSESNDDIHDHLVEIQEKESTAVEDWNHKDKMQHFPESKTNEQSRPEMPSQESTQNDIYEQDKLENIFKQAREQQRDGGSTTTGFSFGALFESQLDMTPDALPESSNQVPSKLPVKDDSNYAVTAGTESNNVPQLEANRPQRQARIGLEFPQSVLDEYENLFFSLNEGPRIIADLESFRNDKEVQEQWQKEREVLTADWKRKQKAALSRKVKKVRRF